MPCDIAIALSGQLGRLMNEVFKDLRPPNLNHSIHKLPAYPLLPECIIDGFHKNRSLIPGASILRLTAITKMLSADPFDEIINLVPFCIRCQAPHFTIDVWVFGPVRCNAFLDHLSLS